MYKAFLFINLCFLCFSFSQVPIPENLPDGITPEFIAQYIRDIDNQNEVTALILQADSLRVIALGINNYLEGVLNAYLNTGKEIRLLTSEPYDHPNMTIKEVNFVGEQTIILLDDRQVLIGGILDISPQSSITQWFDMEKTNMTLPNDFETIWSLP